MYDLIVVQCDSNVFGELTNKMIKTPSSLSVCSLCSILTAAVKQTPTRALEEGLGRGVSPSCSELWEVFMEKPTFDVDPEG